MTINEEAVFATLIDPNTLLVISKQDKIKLWNLHDYTYEILETIECYVSPIYFSDDQLILDTRGEYIIVFNIKAQRVNKFNNKQWNRSFCLLSNKLEIFKDNKCITTLNISAWEMTLAPNGNLLTLSSYMYME